MTEKRDKVREFIVDNFLFGHDEELMDDTSFLDEGILDSTAALELVGFIEEKFLITVEDEEVIPDNLDSIQNIVNFLKEKINS